MQMEDPKLSEKYCTITVVTVPDEKYKTEFVWRKTEQHIKGNIVLHLSCVNYITEGGFHQKAVKIQAVERRHARS